MNWITYLRVIFDKLQNQLQTEKIEIEHIIEALSQIKTLLPLLPRHEYEQRQKFEKGISVHEIQINLKNFRNSNSEKEVSWDDIIDIFVLGNKKQIISHNTGLPQTAFTSDNNFIFSPLDHSTSVKGQSQITNEDIVNISGECDVHEGESGTQIKSTIFKEYRGGRIGSEESGKQNDEDSISILLRGNLNFGKKESQEDLMINYDEASPAVEMICKKIEFKDTSVKKTKIINYGGIDQGEKLTTERRSESRNTMGNQNCSFYLTPSSGNMTPSEIQDQIKSNELSFTIAEQDSKEHKQESNNKKGVFNYSIPFESVKNSPPLKQKRLIPVQQLCCSIHQDANYYDINYSNQKAVSSMQLPIVKRDSTQTLRGINLSKNMFSRLYLLHPIQQKQLLILNMQNNLIQSIAGIEQCCNLQFLNLSHNMITDISNISNLKYLQEAYFSHNLLSSLLITKSNSERGVEIDNILSIFTIWPYLEVLDLSYNKLNDFEEVLQLLSGMTLRKEIIRIISVKGNSFYNYYDNHFTCIDFDLDSKDVIEQFSEYQKYPELLKICFSSEEPNNNQQLHNRNKTSLSSLNLNSITRLQTKSENFTGTLLKDIKKEIQQSKTRLETRKNKENLIQNKTNKSYNFNRGQSMTDRPITSCYQSQQLTFANKFRNNSGQQQKILSKAIKQDLQERDKIKKQKQQKLLKQNKEKTPRTQSNLGNTVRSLQSKLTQNFKKQVDILSSSLSLRNKEPVINYSVLEKPLSRNVKFMNIGPNSDTENSQVVYENKSQLSMASNNFSKFKMRDTSNDTSQRNSIISNFNNISNPNHHYYGGRQNQNFNSINTYLKKSIDINLSFNPNSLLSGQALQKTKAVTTKHSSTNSVYQMNKTNCSPFSTSLSRQNNESRQTCMNRLSIKSMDMSLSNDLIPRKLKHTSPVKPIQLRDRPESKLQNDFEDVDQSLNQIVVPDEKESINYQSVRNSQQVKSQTFNYGQKQQALIRSLKAINDLKKSCNKESKKKKTVGAKKGVQHNQPYQLPMNKRII